MILSTRMMLSRRRVFLAVVLLCLLMGAFAGLHADGHDHAADVCCLAGLACAVAVAIVLLPRIARLDGTPRRVVRRFARLDDPSRHGVALPSALGLAALCRLRV